MDQQTTGRNPWGIVAAVVASLTLGAAGGVWYVRRTPPAATHTSHTPAAPAPMSTPEAPTTAPEIVVTIPQDALARMDLAFADVASAAARTEIRVPGTVQPDGYKQVPVTPVVDGVATQVTVELGQSVKRGQPMARLFSRDLAEAKAALAGFVAELETEHKRLARAQELVKLGAASREELESVEAAHRMHMAHVEEARQRLLYFGLTNEQVDAVAAGQQGGAEIVIPAPIDGAVIARQLNLGQVVSVGQELFTVTDLASVWIEGNLLENDFSAVRVGSRAAITTAAYPNRTYSGSVDYIDPRVDPETRTAKVRVTVANRDLALRLGMYADISFAGVSGAPLPVVPSSAIQQIGTSTVVFTPIDGEPGRFRRRSVTLGDPAPGGRQVTSGIAAGEQVVTNGSFLLRSESLRQHPQ